MMTPPATAKATTTPVAVVRPDNVQAELDALRQRGLASMLNKHFTEEIHKLAQEKAAADAALRDLEQRKANTSEFQASGDGDISPLDSLYMNVNKWRNECRLKEKETLLLYQRYVDRFGATVPIQVPGGVGASNNNTATNTATTYNAGFSSPNVYLVPGAASPTSTGTVSTACASPTWAAVPPPTETPPPHHAPQYNGHHNHNHHPKRRVVSPTKVQVSSMAAEIEKTLEEYLKQGALTLPSIDFMGKDETFQKQYEDQEAEFRNYYRRLLESKGVDAKARDEFKSGKDDAVEQQQEQEQPTMRTLAKGSATSGMLGGHNLNGTGNNNNNYQNYNDDEDEEDEEGQDGLGPLYIHHRADDDEDSVVSGITFNSALTREILDDCERTVVTFLREEKDAIRKMMLHDDTAGDDALANHQDCAHSTKSARSQVSSMCNEAADKAEHMVQQMQEILTNFQRETGIVVPSSNSTINGGKNGGGGSGGDDAQTVVGTVTKEARRFETNNPNEKWMVYYDEYYQREYYHELNSNRTQWEPPAVNGNGSTNGNSNGSDDVSLSQQSFTSRSTPLLSSQDVMPEIHHSPNEAVSSLSRIELYRRKRRRLRKRRIAIGVACLVIMTVLFLTASYNKNGSHQGPDASVVMAMTLPMILWARMESTLQNLTNLVAKTTTTTSSSTASSHDTMQQTDKEEEALAAAALKKAEEEKVRELQRQQEAKAKQEEEARKAAAAAAAAAAKEAAELKAKQEEEEARKAAAAAAAAKEAELKAKQEEERLKLAKEEEEVALSRRRQALMFRMGGHIPMAYFVQDIPLVVKMSAAKKPTRSVSVNATLSSS